MKADVISCGKTFLRPHLGGPTGRELSDIGGVQTETGPLRVRDKVQGEQLGPGAPSRLLRPAGSGDGTRTSSV